MREVAFLQQRAETWKAFEAALQADTKPDPDRLAEQFVTVMDDLAYARTFYPKSQTTQYLNGLATEVHQALYRNKREERSRLLTFWTDELPREVRAARKELLVALSVFLFAMLLGWFSGLNDPSYLRLILGDRYVNMTEENIAAGDPLAVYKDEDQGSMFFGITINNVRVSFLAFAFGVFTSFGTGYLLLTNGIMLGAFIAFFQQRDLLGEMLRVVFIHGTLEISAIVIAGAAGMAMGNALLFPGTYARLAAFVRGARRGGKIVIGLVPVFVTAGLLEGFVTRYTDMPLALSLLIIGGSLAFIIWYFGYYPYAKRFDD